MGKNSNFKNKEPNKNKVVGGVCASGDIVRIVCCTVAVLCLVLGVVAVVYDANLKNQPQMVTSPQVTEVSQFKTALYDCVGKLSADGKNYTIDEEYYNEDVAKKYIATMSGTENPGSEQIAPLLENLFYFLMRDEDNYSLVQKDCYTLVAQTEDKALMNALDYMLIGLTNDEVEKRSKGFYISQNNPEFLNLSYGSANINTSGCGPVCMTMALNYSAGESIATLDEVVAWANEHNMYQENSGTRWAFMREYPAVVGSKVSELYTKSPDVLTQSVADGGVLITSMVPGSHFTDNGHFIVITEIKDGKVRVLDPASIYRTMQEWDLELILEESAGYYWKIYR